MRTTLAILSPISTLTGTPDPYGVAESLEKSSTTPISKAEALKNPDKLITVAGGVTARVVNARLPLHVGQGALWPSEAQPDWLISCNEFEPDHPGLLRINLATGKAVTILTGTGNCDPIRRTAWGTLIFGEEWGGGKEGGRRPEKGRPDGAIFKFVPAKPYTAKDPITELADSPLAQGRVYGLRLGRHEGGRDYGQGTQRTRRSSGAAWCASPTATTPTCRATGASGWPR